ncbi:MAG TPA: tetraacyldisaccharide 4'-kinase [Pyrinomonadaceae bacterium]|nr:tetraacyldisaccharide 4'-kinase [Pyrinomonadaceae bacterium]
MVILAPVGWLYGRATDLRNALYDRGVFRSYDLGARTISVGNLTTGGTGKTPLVAHIADILAANGDNVCILTRGYGRRDENERVLVADGTRVLVDAETGGDEPVELARKLVGKAIIVADADRVVAAKWAKAKFDVTTFILDDGFQHRRAKRDLDIVCVDATKPFRNAKILPEGNLRESLNGLKRADNVVVTGIDQAEDIRALQKEIREINPAANIFSARTQIVRASRLEDFLGRSVGSPDDIPRSAFAFCGIGNPESFFASLVGAQIVPVGRRSLRDHYPYNQTDVENIEGEAEAAGAESLITTGKDAVKLKNLTFRIPCFVVETEILIDEADEFRRLIFPSY